MVVEKQEKLQSGPSSSAAHMEYMQSGLLHERSQLFPSTIGPPDSFMFDWRLAVTSIIVMIAGAMSASVGVGGGGVYVPLFMIVANLDTKGAIPVSKICILGVAITTWAINLTKRHPKANRPLINYSVALLMAPTTILGTVFGIMLFIMFPQWFILILLVFVLGVTDYRTIVKALQLHRKEEAEKRVLAGPLGVNNDEDDRTSLLHGDDAEGHREYGGGGSTGSNEDASADAGGLLDKESRTPVHKIAFLVFLWLSMLLLVMTRGGGDGKEDVTYAGVYKCSWQFWILTVVIILFLGCGAAAGVWAQWRRTKALRAAGIPTVDGDIEWTPLKFAGFIGIGCFAGTCAGFLGIGSGMINVPYMLEVGMSPEVAAATSSFIIIFTALSTVVQYILADLMPFKSAAWYGTLGLISAIIGQFAIGAIVKKYKKASIISFLLAGLITVSAIGLIGMASFKMAAAVKEHDKNYWRFQPYCPAHNTTVTKIGHSDSVPWIPYAHAQGWELFAD